MKMHSLAENLKEAMPSKKQTYYPSIYVTSKQLPGIKTEIGKKGFLIVEYQVKSISEQVSGPKNISLDLLAAAPYKKGKSDE